MWKQIVRTLTGTGGGESGEVHEVLGVRVVVFNTRPDIATDAVLVRLEEALALIELAQPWRLAHLRRDVRQIVVMRYACRGAWMPAQGSVMTELTFLARTDIGAETVASSILHEGVHARVDRMGVRADARDRAREERICRRAELAFGEALPPRIGAPVIERALASLALGDSDVAPVIDPSEALRRQQEVDAAALDAWRRNA